MAGNAMEAMPEPEVVDTAVDTLDVNRAFEEIAFNEIVTTEFGPDALVSDAVVEGLDAEMDTPLTPGLVETNLPGVLYGCLSGDDDTDGPPPASFV